MRSYWTPSFTFFLERQAAIAGNKVDFSLAGIPKGKAKLSNFLVVWVKLVESDGVFFSRKGGRDPRTEADDGDPARGSGDLESIGDGSPLVVIGGGDHVEFGVEELSSVQGHPMGELPDPGPDSLINERGIDDAINSVKIPVAVNDSIPGRIPDPLDGEKDEYAD